jgi:predicted DCC family thiol-disulfide oxidoreductase YuxK
MTEPTGSLAVGAAAAAGARAGFRRLARRAASRREAPVVSASDPPTIFFDGDCALCARAVRLCAAHDRRGRYHFAPLRGRTAARVLGNLGVEAWPAGTVVLVEGGRMWTRSAAVLRVARHLDFPWNLFWLLVLVPRPVRDRVYDALARRRLAWFGAADVCAAPPPGLKERLRD